MDKNYKTPRWLMTSIIYLVIIAGVSFDMVKDFQFPLDILFFGPTSILLTVVIYRAVSPTKGNEELNK